MNKEPASSSSGWALAVIDGRWLDVVLIGLSVVAWYATSLLSLRLVDLWTEPARVMVSLAVATGVCAMGAWRADTLVRFARTTFSPIQRMPVWSLLVIGLTLRVLWILLFPAEPGSDGATYLGLAKKLAAGGEYETSGTYAYWPPGYPIVLGAWLKLWGDSRGAWLSLNLVLYLIAATGVFYLGRRLAGDSAGRLALALFACWPNLVAHAATPEKEMVVVAALPWVCCVVILILNGGRNVGLAVLAGALMGVCLLVQPSLQFLLPSLAILILLVVPDRRRAMTATGALVLGAVLVVGPWSYRNVQVFDRFVLVSTNGGSNLYRANNPLATGGYTKRGEVDLSGLGELEQDARGRQLGVQWIAANPGRFAQLALEKQARFMGDDAGGVYNTIKVGKASDSEMMFVALKGGANLWWLGVWTLLMTAVLSARRAAADLPAWSRLPVWLWLYLFALHSVFESTGKYHVPMAWVLPVLVGVFMCGVEGREQGRPK